MPPQAYATQIWPFREDFGEDMPTTMARLAEMGFAGVELCRWFHWTDMFDKWSAEHIQQVSQQTGLQVVSTHISFPTIAPENIGALIRFAHMVGMRYAVVAAVPEELVTTRAAVLGVADQFSRAAATLKSEGISIGYHNHSFDFKPLAEDGSLPWDIFFDHTDPAVVMQLDIGHVYKGGGDPIYYLIKYPGRAKMLHLRAYSAQKTTAALGEGEINWGEIFEVCGQFQQPDWYILEQESPGYNVWDSAANSLKYLWAQGW